MTYPCRDHSREGYARMAEKRWVRRAQRIANRINGRRRAWLRELGYESPHSAPIYPALALKAWHP